MQYCLNYSGTRFCPLKIKITQFPDGLRLTLLWCLRYIRPYCAQTELVIHLINTRLFCLLFYHCMSNKTQSYSRRLYNSSIAEVINGKLVTEVLALPSYSLYAIDHPRLFVKQVPFVSLRIQPSHLAPCRSEWFAGETSTTNFTLMTYNVCGIWSGAMIDRRSNYIVYQ